MSKYQELARHLATLGTERWRPRFREIEAIVGPLPPSACKYQA